MPMWLAMVLWAVVVAVGCGVAFVQLLGRAFSRRSGGEPVFAKMVLGPGVWVAENRPVGIFVVSWLVWWGVGAGVMFVLYHLHQ